MNLLSIVQTIWRHKLATASAILVTVVGAFYILAVQPPVYHASSSLLFLSPQGPPSKAQIAADPSLATISNDNPYATLGELWTASAVVSAVSGDSPPAQVTLSADTDTPPIVEIAGTGANAQVAIANVNQATNQVTTMLSQMQQRAGVNQRYMIKAVELTAPTSAQKSTSAKLRPLIAVLAAGVILLLVLVSVGQALEERRAGGSKKRQVPATAHLWQTAKPEGDKAWAQSSAAPGSQRADGGPAAPGWRADKGIPETSFTGEDTIMMPVSSAQSDGNGPGGSADLPRLAGSSAVVRPSARTSRVQ
jgi:hypothetical protein